MKKFLSLLCAAILLLGVAGYASADSTYYVYADFSSADGFLGGYDVDSYGDYIYVNNSTGIDRYTVTTTVNPDPTLQPDVNTHPDNVGPDGISGTADDNVGPMAVRTLTYDTTYSVPAIGGQSVSEIYAAAGGLYFLDGQNDVSYYDFTAATTAKVTADSSVNLSQLTRSSNGTWYASNEQSGIYQYDGEAWQQIATHIVSPNGSHLDGLAIAALDVTDDGMDNAEEWIFVADMTSDYMKRYSLAGVFQEQYKYGLTGRYLEGMGFGANNHFWATSGGNLYEIGGGAFEYIEEPPPAVPEPSTILLMGIGLAGLAGYRRKKLSKK